MQIDLQTLIVPEPPENPENLLMTNPSWPERHSEALGYFSSGNLAKARTTLEPLVAEDPENRRGLHLLGLICYEQGNLQDAVQLLSQCVELHPGFAEAQCDLGVMLNELGHPDQALTAYTKAIALNPVYHPAFYNLGHVYQALGKNEAAAACYRSSIEIAGDFADGHINLGITLLALGKREEALQACFKAAALAPRNTDALLALGQALRACGKSGEAVALYQRLIALHPRNSAAISGLACAFRDDGQIHQALAMHRQTLEADPEYAEAHNALGDTFRQIGRYTDALKCYKYALLIAPGNAAAQANIGTVHRLAGESDLALEAVQKAIELDPNLAAAYLCYAGVFADQGQIPEGLACYSMALALNQDHPEALAGYQRLSREACEWEGLSDIEDKIRSSTYHKGIAILPSPLLHMDCSAEDHLIAARQWARRIASPLAEPLSGGLESNSRKADRIRLGYIYGDLDEFDASGHLASVVTNHDRDRFDVLGFCYGAEEASGLRQQLDASCDSHVNIGHLCHAAAAREIHGSGIDILIDLEGYGPHARQDILACRPAPVQVNYLGFPASMGAAFTDYIIADRVTVPMDQQPFFDEKIVQLPGCYLPGVPQFARPSPGSTPSRADCRLPETGVVLCCFNAHAKITSSCFAIWMRILRDVPGSVLWLAEPQSVAAKNIRLNAAALGIDPARLIFAPECSREDHIARLGNADLFLDTMPSSSAAAVNDALAAGVPVLGCAGETFVSRITASQLRTCNLSDFITYAPDHYEQVAHRLARDRKYLARQRDRVSECVQNTDLFDSAAYQRNLEAAFERMIAHYRKGKAPEAFAVPQICVAQRIADTQAGENDTEPLLLDELAEEDATASMLGRIPFKACPVCDSNDFVYFKSTDASQHPCYTPAISPTMCWQRCSGCDHIFTTGYFSRESKRLIRAQILPDQEAGASSPAERASIARIVNTVAKLMPSGEWLDVGCGNAGFLIAAREAGYKTFSVGYREANAERLRQLGYESWPCSFEELDIKERFSAISLNDHLLRAAQPVAALNAAHRMLKPGGVIICSLANKATASWLFGDQSGKDPYWSDLNYFHSFTRERFDALLAQQSFEPESHDENDRQSAMTSVIAVRIETGPPEDQ